MNKHLKPHIFVATVGFIAFFYSLYILQRDIGSVHQSAQSFFDQGSGIYPFLVVAAVGIVPVLILVLASLAIFDKTRWYTIPVSIYIWFVLGGYAITAFLALFLIWQFWSSRHAST